MENTSRYACAVSDVDVAEALCSILVVFGAGGDSQAVLPRRQTGHRQFVPILQCCKAAFY